MKRNTTTSIAIILAMISFSGLVTVFLCAHHMSTWAIAVATLSLLVLPLAPAFFNLNDDED